MGIMDLIFPKKSKILKNEKNIEDALRGIDSLDYKERPEVFEALVKELDNGGVSEQEFDRVIRELRRDRKISEIDAKNLRNLKNQD